MLLFRLILPALAASFLATASFAADTPPAPPPHGDHGGGIAALRARYTVPVYGPAAEAIDLLTDRLDDVLSVAPRDPRDLHRNALRRRPLLRSNPDIVSEVRSASAAALALIRRRSCEPGVAVANRLTMRENYDGLRGAE